MARVSPGYIAQRARAHGLDADAVLRVFSTEGLSGGIGDNGHAFGPAQLNNAGGVITGKFPGWSQQQIQDWAWSPAGVEYALQGIARVAKGLSGSQAVHAIVGDTQIGGHYTGFERPANEGAEIARSLGRTQLASPQAVRGLAVPSQTVPSGQPDISPLVAALLLRQNAPAPITPIAPVFPSIASAAAQPVPMAAPVPSTAFRSPQLVFSGPSLTRPLG